MAPLEINQVIAIFFGLIIIYFLARLLYLPAKLLLMLLGNGLVGGILLAIFNVLGSFWGISIGVNAFTALLVGLLGVPGIILLLVLRHLTA